MVVDAESLIERIYEAGVIPDLWPDVLAQLDERYEGMGTTLFTVGSNYIRWTSSPNAIEHVNAFVTGGWAARNVRPARALARGLVGFTTEADLFTAEELRAEPLYADFLRPRGSGSELGTIIRVPTGDDLALSINRPFQLGPASQSQVASANALLPHLARAALFSARLGLERARAAAQALAAVGLPAATLGEAGRLLAANDLFEALMPAVVLDRNQRIGLANAAADRLLSEALTRMRHDPLKGGVNSIPIKAREGYPPIIVHLLPIERAANDLFSGAGYIILLTPVEKRSVPSAEVLAGLFDLTPAEARVARAAGEAGRTLEEIAFSFGVSRETVKTQMRSVLAKTGTNRQDELLLLLAGSAGP